MSKKKPSKGQIVNYYNVIPSRFIEKIENNNFDSHNFEIPFRMSVAAPSGSGKTNFITNCISEFCKGKGTFVSIIIITKNKDEPLYKWLESESDNIRIYEGLQNNPDLDKFDKKFNHLIIWDDLVLSKKVDTITDYFIRARKLNVSLMFLSQSYIDIPKVIRKNSSYLVVLDLGGSKREQDYILREWGSDLEKEELRAIYNDATSQKLSPLIITGGKVDKNKKYRKSFLDYYNLDTFFKGKDVKKVSKKKEKLIEYESDSD
jgi:hypothetical protein